MSLLRHNRIYLSLIFTKLPPPHFPLKVCSWLIFGFNHGHGGNPDSYKYDTVRGIIIRSAFLPKLDFRHSMVCSLDDHLVLRSLQLLHAFYTSMFLEVIAVLHYNNHDGVIHACVLKACISSKYSKCISAIKRILYTTEMYISSSSFVYLCFFSLSCDAC